MSKFKTSRGCAFISILFLLGSIFVFSHCSGGDASDSAPLVSIPIEASMSASLDAGSETSADTSAALVSTTRRVSSPETRAVVFAGPGTGTAGNTLRLTHSSGDSDSTTILADGSGEAVLTVPGSAGDTVSVVQIDSNSNESSAVDFTVPSTRISVHTFNASDIFIDSNLGVAYVLGNDPTTGAAQIRTLDLSSFVLETTASLTNGSTALTNAKQFVCLAGTSFCMVVFDDSAQTIGTFNTTTGASISTTTNTIGTNDEIALFDFDNRTTIQHTAYVSSTGSASNTGTLALLYFNIDASTGAIGTSNTVSFAAVSGLSASARVETTFLSVSPLSDQLLASARKHYVAFVMQLVDSSSTTNLLYTVFDPTTTSSGSAISNQTLDSLSPALDTPSGMRLINSVVAANSVTLLLSQNSGSPEVELYRIDPSTPSIDTTLDIPDVPEGPGPISIYQKDSTVDCGDSTVVLVGNRSERSLTAYTFNESDSTTPLIELDSLDIGLSSNKVEHACVDGEIVSALLSQSSNDITFLSIDNN